MTSPPLGFVLLCEMGAAFKPTAVKPPLQSVANETAFVKRVIVLLADSTTEAFDQANSNRRNVLQWRLKQFCRSSGALYPKPLFYLMLTVP
jgi:hypothetical protein